MISFEELEFQGDNITENAIRLDAQAGAVFGNMKPAAEALEVAKDNVKYVLGKIEMETHTRGSIPSLEKGGKDIKITGAAMTSYLNQHPEVVKAREERQQAIANYENVKALCSTYNSKKALLEIRMADKKNEWYSAPTEKAGNKFDLD